MHSLHRESPTRFSGVDLIYVFRSFQVLQVLEPGLNQFDVTIHRGLRDILVQDHLARIGFPGPKALRPIEISQGLVAARDDEQCRAVHKSGRARFNAASTAPPRPRDASDKTGFSGPRRARGPREGL